MAEKKEAPPATAPAGGNKKKLIIIIIAAVLVLLLAGGGAFYFLVLNKKHAEGDDKKDGGHKKEKPIPGAVQEGAIGPMIEIKEFIVNIISGDNSHYVKAAMSLELNNELAVEEVNKRMPQIRDAVLLLISNKTMEELQDLQGKKQLKAELRAKINTFLTKGKVKDIYFTDFVVQ